MNRFANALVGAAAANVALHEVVYIRIRGLRLLAEQCHCGHDLPRLAVTALWYVYFHPRLLHGMATVGREPLNCGDLFSRHCRNRRNAGASRLAVDMKGARATKRHAATEFCAGQV